jgi:hypothetical protein
MFTDKDRSNVHDAIYRQQHRLFAHLLSPDLFLQAALMSRCQIIRSPLNLVNLVWLALRAACSPDNSFSSLLGAPLDSLRDDERFPGSALDRILTEANARHPDPDPLDNARHKHKGRCQNRKRHDPRRAAAQPPTPTAFYQARISMPPEFWIALFVLLAQRFQAEHADIIRWGRFRLLALDGTRLTLPDYPALRDHFGTANNSTGSHNAQARMVLLEFPLARLPVAYALKPVKIGEPTMARQLLKGLQPNDLVLLDAGFRSYGVLAQIRQEGAFFCVRLGQKLNLKVTKKLGSKDDVLVTWRPKDSRGKWRKEGLPKEIEMRRLTYKSKGFRPLVLLTNVLSPEEVPYDKWWGLTVSEEGEVLARGIYNFRWEVETTYRELKVEQKLEGGLRSRTPEGIEYEVAGHVLYYLLTRWVMVEAAVAAKVSPLRLSFLEARREIEQMTPQTLLASEKWLQETLRPRLLQRLAEHVVRVRPGRSFPRKARQRRASKRANTAAFRRARKAKARCDKQAGRQPKPKPRSWFGDGWNLQGRINAPT